MIVHFINQSSYLSVSNNRTVGFNITTNGNSTQSGSGNIAELIRDFALNALTTVFHLVAFMFILVPTSVKPSLRMFLMSLSLPGFLQNFSWAVIRIETIWFRGPFIAKENGCKCLLFITELAILCGQTTVSGLTLNNYLAVSYPILFKRLMTPCKTFLCLACMWCFWGIVSLSETVTRADSEKKCVPIIVASPYMLLIEAMVILFTTIIVAILNLKLIIQLWGKFKVFPIEYDTRNSTRNVGLQFDTLNQEKFSNIQSGSAVFSIADEPSNSRLSPTQPSLTKHNIQDSSTNETNHQQCFMELCFECTTQQQQPPPTNSPTNINKPQRKVRFNIVSPEHASDKSKMKLRMRRRPTQSRVRKMAVTLTVLTIWNSIGYLPFMACLLMAFANREGDYSQSVQSISNIGGTLIRISTIGNTFIYAWRFIRWRTVCSTTAVRCVCCQ